MGDYFGSSQELLSEILRDFRKENGYTQKKIADYLGIDRSTYAKYETSRKPELDVIIRLAALYNVSVDEFLGNYRNNAVCQKDVKSLAKASAPENNNGSCLSREELRLLNLYRKSIRKSEIITFARKIAAEDSNSPTDSKN